MRSNQGPTHYEVLGVMADAGNGAIRQAYRVQAKLAHPDAGGSPERFRLVLDAYQVLSNPAKRRDYDDSVGIRPGPTPGAAATTDGWTGARGDFTGSVDFPAYLRDVVDAPWQAAAEEPSIVTDDGVDPAGAAGPADILWWWPDQAIASPVTAGPLVLVPSPTAVVALAALTGHEAWRAELGSRPTGSVVVIGDTVMVWTENGLVHGLELGRGVTRWTVPVGPPGPGGLSAAGRFVVAAGTDARVVAIDAATAKPTWAVKLTAAPTVTLAIAGTMAVAVTGTTVEGFDTRKGRFRWRTNLRSPVELPPCAVGDVVWLAGGGRGGSLVRLDAATGAVAGTFAAGSAVAGLATDGRLLFASVAGPPRLIAVDDEGRLFLSADLPNVCPEPAIDDDHAYLADPSGRLYAVDRLRRRVSSIATVPFEPVGAPTIIGDRLILLARDGRLWATAVLSS